MKYTVMLGAAVLIVAGLLAGRPTPIHAEQSLQGFKQDCTRAGGFTVELVRQGTTEVYRVTCHYPDGGRSNCSTLDISDAGAIVTSDSTCSTIWNEQTTSGDSVNSTRHAQPAPGSLPSNGKTAIPVLGQR